MKQEIKYVLAVFVMHLITLVLSAAAVISEEWIVSPQGITRYSLSCVNNSDCLVPPSDLLRASGAFRILSWIGEALFILSVVFLRFSKSQTRYLILVGLSAGLAAGLCLFVAQTDYTAKVRSYFSEEEFHFGYSFHIAWAATTVGIIGVVSAAWVLYVIARGRFGLPDKKNKRSNSDIQTVSGSTPGSPYAGDFGVLHSRNASIKHSRFRIPSDPPAQTEAATSRETPQLLPRQLDQASEVVITRHEDHGIVINYRAKPIISPPTSPSSPKRFDPSESLRGILKNTKPEDVPSTSTTQAKENTTEYATTSFPPGDFSRVKSQQDLPYLAAEVKTKQVLETIVTTPDEDNGIQINIEPVERRQPPKKPEGMNSRPGSGKRHRKEKRRKPHNLRILAKHRHVGGQRTHHAKPRQVTTKKYATVTMTDKGLKVKTVEVTQ